MNYLAHLSLAYPHEGLMGGNFIADLIRKKDEFYLHPSLIQGILLHRWIDHFSNNNEALTKINKAFHSSIHKYAPVATDIISDYLLYISWERYYTISFAEFSDYNYKILHAYSEFMPEKTAEICRNMIHNKWLEQYQTLAGVEEVLVRTNKKLRFPVDLRLVLPIVVNNQDEFIELFNLFYTECKMQCNEWISLQNEGKK